MVQGQRLPVRLIGATVLALSACGSGGERGSLVLVTIDTLRADHLGCYGYFRDTSPRLDALATECVVFDNLFAPMATTLPSHTSLLTGLEPLEHQILANATQGGHAFRRRGGVRTLAELALEEGYDTAAFVSAAPLKRHAGLDSGFRVYDEPEGRERRAGETVERALAWLRARDGGPFILWVHLFDPHWPFDPPPAHDVFATDAGLEAWIAERRIPERVPYERRFGDAVTRPDHNKYDGEIRYADAELARLVDALRASGVLEDAALVVTADHGESLNEHGWPAHERIHANQVRIPWLLRPPGGRGELPPRLPTLATISDVLPTALAFVDAELRDQLAVQASGRDLLAEDFDERPVLSLRSIHRVDETGPMYAWTTREWRYFYRPQEGDALFDVAHDPNELASVLAANAELGARLRHELLAEVADQRTRGEVYGQGELVPLEEETRAELDALGYGE